MRIGLDFDNTIVSYDALFRKVAREWKAVPDQVPANKVAVRNHLRECGQEDLWTEMQGHVYGTRMNEASAYPGAIDFMISASAAGHVLSIVSHKTRLPFRGPQNDLHAAARGWIDSHLCLNGRALISSDRIFFELTKEEKINRIRDCECDVYLDDLPEILLAEGFPAATRGILFDPENHHNDLRVIPVIQSWG